MYSTAVCPFCKNALSLLAKYSVVPEEIKVDKEPEKREEMIARSQGLRTVPQIFIDGEHIGGFDKLSVLHSTGELKKKLGLE